MTTKGTPSARFKWKSSVSQLRKSYAVRLEAQFGDRKAKQRLDDYNRMVRERKMEANQIEWEVDGRKFNRYKMMEYISNRVSNGEPLPEVCGVEGMPSMRTVYGWFDNHPEFERDMRRAEEIRGHRLGEEALRIALSTDRVNVNADKLKVETLSKAAARANTRFQDKAVVQNTDEYANMTAEQLQTRIRRMVEASPDLRNVLTEAGVDAASLGVPEMQEPLPVLVLPTLDCDPTDTADEVDT